LARSIVKKHEVYAMAVV